MFQPSAFFKEKLEKVATEAAQEHVNALHQLLQVQDLNTELGRKKANTILDIVGGIKAGHKVLEEKEQEAH